MTRYLAAVESDGPDAVRDLYSMPDEAMLALVEELGAVGLRSSAWSPRRTGIATEVHGDEIALCRVEAVDYWGERLEVDDSVVHVSPRVAVEIARLVRQHRPRSLDDAWEIVGLAIDRCRAEIMHAPGVAP